MANQTDSELREKIRTIWRPLYDMGYKGAEQIDAQGMAMLISSAVDETEKLIATHDQTLKQKLLEALPEKKNHTSLHTKTADYMHDRGFDQALLEATKAIEQVYGDE